MTLFLAQDTTTSLPLMMGFLMVAAYFFGAVPFGYVVGKLKGVDVRKEGSGNIGATNVGRILGKRYFWIVFALDALKGLVPMLVGAWLIHQGAGGGREVWTGSIALWLGVGFAALVGHIFPVYLGFKGGKGVATALGVMLGVYPYYTLTAVPAVLVFVGVFAASRIISLSSILGAGLFPVLLLVMGWMLGWQLLGYRWPLLAFAVVVAGLVIFRHRTNIQRLRMGTEPRFVSKRGKVS